MLAKLACGINKPNKQTILPMNSVADFFQTIKISKMLVQLMIPILILVRNCLFQSKPGGKVGEIFNRIIWN